MRVITDLRFVERNFKRILQFKDAELFSPGDIHAKESGWKDVFMVKEDKNADSV